LQNTKVLHKKGMASACILQQYFYLWCKDDKKDFYFLEVLITYLLPELKILMRQEFL